MVCAFNVNEKDTDVHVYVCAGYSHACEKMWLKAWGETRKRGILRLYWKLKVDTSIYFIVYS